jgi:transcription antitermination factor NusG
MISTRPINSREFRVGDQVVLAEGPYQGTSGVFLRLREDVNWAEIKELNSMVRYHPVRWLQRSDLTRPGQLYQARP